jgi:hypothetical protein
MPSGIFSDMGFAEPAANASKRKMNDISVVNMKR